MVGETFVSVARADLARGTWKQDRSVPCQVETRWIPAGPDLHKYLLQYLRYVRRSTKDGPSSTWHGLLQVRIFVLSLTPGPITGRILQFDATDTKDPRPSLYDASNPYADSH